MKRPADRRNARVLLICAGAALAMLGAAYAAVPLYNLFCRTTGYGGATKVAEAAPDTVLAREVTVLFDGTVADGAPLRFTPRDRAITVRLGQRALAYYEVANMSDRPVTAIASYNVTPFKTGPFFNKLQCFCFTEQTFAPGQTMELAVLFFVDPEMDSDERLDEINEITLSYTFFRKPEAEDSVAAARIAGDAAGG